ncbi:cytochrome P450 6a9-like [Anoplophora glabripennis]|uniref:cytochrome P450 6a9-like n=1 Tax=Anoplophora glabripennis TaxID=217634 RepID=UPI0008736748|nr:cytochrome P450 6a9-like [Anoplophora glabripennis]
MYLVVTENIHLILLATLAVLIYVYFKRAHSFWRRMGVPQLNPTFPFGDVASVVLRRQNMAEKVKEVYDRMKGQKCVGMYFFSRPTFLPLDPVLIKDIQSTDFEHFYDRGIYYDEENDPISAHLFSIAGPKWKRLRAKMTPAFSPGKLKYMFDTIAQCGHQMIDLLKQLTSEERGAVEIKEILARYTTDVIGCCAFGLECNCMRNPQAEFRMMGKRAFTQTIGDLLKMIVIRSFPSLARLLRIGVFSRTVTNFFYRVVKETIEYREKNNVTRNDFLQLLIQLRKDGQLDDNQNSENAKVPGVTGLTMEEAAAQAFIFFLAGFETTSTTISFALFEMATNEDIQLKARKEVVKVFKTFGGLSYESVMEMHYLDTIIFDSKKVPSSSSVSEEMHKDLPDTRHYQFHQRRIISDHTLLWAP